MGVRPFAVFQETCRGTLKPGCERIEHHHLDEIVALQKGWSASRDLLAARLHEGQIGVLLRVKGRIVSLVWCDLGRLSNPMCARQLRAHEAYSYELFTVDSARGRGYAPIVKGHLLGELASMGRTNCLSVVDLSNRPSLRCKEKMKASRSSIGLHFRAGAHRRTVWWDGPEFVHAARALQA